MRGFTAVCVLLLLVAGTVPAQASVDPAHLIAPGVGIGPVKLGMAIGNVAALLGTPTAAQVFTHGAVLPARGGATAFYWPKSRWLVETDRTGIVYDVAILNDPQCSTADGLHDGLTPADIRAKWGPPSRSAHAQTGSEFLVYDSRGVTFVVSRNRSSALNGRIIRIDVFTPPTP